MLTKNKKSKYLVFIAAIFCSLVIGWQVSAWSLEPIPENLSIGRDTYLESCSNCHIAIPPELMPTETWRKILEKPQNHYGISLNLISLTQVLIWNYLKNYSRPLSPGERPADIVDESRYFRALHPNVDLPKVVTLKTCISCHPSANTFDFRTLSKEWNDTP